MPRSRRPFTALFALSLLLPATSAFADFTWDGEDPSDLWTDGVNWDGDVAPGFDLGGMDLIFGPTGSDQSPDAGAGAYFNIDNLLFTGADAELTLIGTGSLTFNDAATITNDSTFLQTINIDIFGSGSSLLIDAMAGDLVFGGAFDLNDTGGVALTVQGDNDTTIDGIISGVGGTLIKDGDGILTLNGANMYDGGTTLSAGTIILGDDDALGTGMLSVTGDSIIMSDDDARDIGNDVDIATTFQLEVAGANDIELSGIISGDGTLFVDMDAADTEVILSGVNSYTGTTQIGSGTIVLANDDALGAGNLEVLKSSSQIASDDDARTIANDIDIVPGAMLQFVGAFDLTLDGFIDGDGGFRIDTDADDVRLMMNGDNDYNGATRMTQGTLVLGHDNAIGNGVLIILGDSFLESTDDARVMDNGIQLNSSSTLTIQGANNIELGGIIGGLGDLAIDLDTAADTVTFTETNGWVGNLDLIQGTVITEADQALGFGMIRVMGDSIIETTDDQRSLSNSIFVDTGFTLTLTGGGYTLLGNLSGDGTLELDAADPDSVFTLGGTLSTIDGVITLNQGTLVLASDSALGDAGLTLVGNAAVQSDNDARMSDADFDTGGFTLTLNGDNDLLLSGDIIGGGGVTKEDDGILTLTGDSTFTGDFNIDGGTVILEGSVDSNVLVNEDAILQSDGQIAGDLTITEDGLVQPGNNGIGTLEIGGNFTQQEDGILMVQINREDGLSDCLEVTGMATLDDGAIIQADVMGDGGFIVSGEQFTIIDAVGGVFDNGAIIVSDTATLTISIAVSDDFTDGDMEYILEVSRNENAYSDAAVGRDNEAIGSGLDSTVPIAEADPTTPIAGLLGELDSLNATEYNIALNELSPQPYQAFTRSTFDGAQSFASMQSSYLMAKRSGIEEWQRFRNNRWIRPGSLASAELDPGLMAAAIQEADEAQESGEMGDGMPTFSRGPRVQRLGTFFELFSSDISLDSSGSRTGYDADLKGFQGGLDYRFSPELIGGFAVGYSDNDLNLADRRGTLDGDSLRFGPYMSWYRDNWFVDALVSGAFHSTDSTREIRSLDRTVQGDFDAFEISTAVKAGWTYEVNRTVFLTPTATLQYTYVDVDGFTETGGDGAALKVSDRTTDSLRARVGVALSGRLDWGMKVIPSVFVGWDHEFLDDGDDVEATFAAGGTQFGVGSGSPERNQVVFGAGFHALIESNFSAYFRYEGEFGDDSDVNTFYGGFSLAF